MTRTVRGVLEAPTVLRLDEAVELPLNVPVEVTIARHISQPDGEPPESTFLKLAELWEEYVAEDERKRRL